MPNIKCHNQKMLQGKPQTSPESCHYIKKDDYPMNGLWFTENVLYYDTISANKKDSPNYINEIAKQLSKNDLRTTKNLLTSKSTRKILNLPLGIGPLKKINSVLKCHGKSKGNINLKIPFPEYATYA